MGQSQSTTVESSPAMASEMSPEARARRILYLNTRAAKDRQRATRTEPTMSENAEPTPSEPDPIAALLASIAADPNIPSGEQEGTQHDQEGPESPRRGVQEAAVCEPPAAEEKAPVPDAAAEEEAPVPDAAAAEETSVSVASRPEGAAVPVTTAVEAAPAEEEPGATEQEEHLIYVDYTPRDFGNEDLDHLTPEWMRYQMKSCGPELSLKHRAMHLMERVMDAIWVDPSRPWNMTVTAGPTEDRALVIIGGIWREAEMEGVQAAMQTVAVELVQDRLREEGEPPPPPKPKPELVLIPYGNKNESPPSS